MALSKTRWWLVRSRVNRTIDYRNWHSFLRGVANRRVPATISRLMRPMKPARACQRTRWPPVSQRNIPVSYGVKVRPTIASSKPSRRHLFFPGPSINSEDRREFSTRFLSSFLMFLNRVGRCSKSKTCSFIWRQPGLEGSIR